MYYIIIVFLIILPILTFFGGYKLGDKKDDPVGNLLYAEDPEDGVYFFMELTKQPKDILKKKEIILKVGKNNSSYNGKN